MLEIIIISKVCITKKRQFIIKNLTVVYVLSGAKIRMTGQKEGILKCVVERPNLYILAELLFKHIPMKKISKPVYRRIEFLFPSHKSLHLLINSKKSPEK